MNWLLDRACEFPPRHIPESESVFREKAFCCCFFCRATNWTFSIDNCNYLYVSSVPVTQSCFISLECKVIHFSAKLKHAPQENVPFVLPKVTCVSFISIAKANACYSCFSPTSFWPPTGNFRILNGITQVKSDIFMAVPSRCNGKRFVCSKFEIVWVQHVPWVWLLNLVRRHGTNSPK